MTIDRPPLTDQQLALLRWIGDGCPEGVWPDHSHKMFMRVLETRALAATRRWYGKWGAELLPGGVFYLAHGTYPDQEPDLTVGQPAATHTERAKPPRPEQVRPARPAGQKVAAASKINASQQLINDILAAGGSVRFAPATDKARASLTTRIRLARAKGYVPEGKKLSVSTPRWGVWDIAIVDLPEWLTAELAPIRVRRSLDHLHSVVEALRDDHELLAIKNQTVRNRSLRLMQALVQAAAANRYKVAIVRQHNNWDHRTGRDRPGQIRFTVHAHEVEVRISQVPERVEHKPTADERRWNEQYGTRYRKWDFVPSSRLQIEMPGRFVHRASSWADSDASRLEDRLAELVQEMGLRADEAERDRIRQEEARQQAARDREARIARATVKLIEANRAKVLEDQLNAWLRSRQLGGYLDAMQAVVAQVDDPAVGVAAGEWLAWARGYAAALDPLRKPLAMPPDPEPTYTALQPYMERASDWFG